MRRLLAVVVALGLLGRSAGAIEPWPQRPWYWSVDGSPLLLLGGSDDDNLFQWPPELLLPQLDRLAGAGGNVIRNTMSDRPDKGFEIYPFLLRDDGKYDLSQWNPEYWERFERLLRETQKRRIFIQIEIWDRFDYTDQGGSDRWRMHPYRPANNVNYTAEESGFADRYPDHPGANKQPFFFTTPQQKNNQVVLRFQEAFVNKLLDHALPYDHVLYCIDNETQAQPQWGQYWAELVRQRSQQAGKKVMITEMWDDWDLKAKRHRQTFDHPELYDFVDVSQNNQNRGQKHWDNFLYVRRYLSSHPRPINTTKTYGADGNKFGHTDQDAIERFWRHLLAGAASIRFHRPPSGLGLNDKAVACLRAARKVEALAPAWTLQPANELLADRGDNEAYLAANVGTAYVLYFPTSGAVALDLSQQSGMWRAQWMDIDAGDWCGEQPIQGGQRVTIQTPQAGNTVCVITAITASDPGRVSPR